MRRGGTQKKTKTIKKDSTPDVTSTSTGRMINLSSLGALVLIRMKAVWLSSSLDEKLALITPFVSKGAISLGTKKTTARSQCGSWVYKTTRLHKKLTISAGCGDWPQNQVKGAKRTNCNYPRCQNNCMFCELNVTLHKTFLCS